MFKFMRFFRNPFAKGLRPRTSKIDIDIKVSDKINASNNPMRLAQNGLKDLARMESNVKVEEESSEKDQQTATVEEMLAYKEPPKEGIHYYKEFFTDLGASIDHYNGEIKIEFPANDKFKSDSDVMKEVESILLKIARDRLGLGYWQAYPKVLDRISFDSFLKENGIILPPGEMMSDPETYVKTRDILKLHNSNEKYKDIQISSSMSDNDIRKSLSNMSNLMGTVISRKITWPRIITDYYWVFRHARLSPENGTKGLARCQSLCYGRYLAAKIREETMNGENIRIQHFKEGKRPSETEEPLSQFSVTVYIFRFLKALDQAKKTYINNKLKNYKYQKLPLIK